jgi:hypothetical protein
VTAPLPDIPVVDLIAEAFFIDSQGCFKPVYGPPDVFPGMERQW